MNNSSRFPRIKKKKIINTLTLTTLLTYANNVVFFFTVITRVLFIIIIAILCWNVLLHAWTHFDSSALYYTLLLSDGIRNGLQRSEERQTIKKKKKKRQHGRVSSSVVLLSNERNDVSEWHYISIVFYVTRYRLNVDSLSTNGIIR